MTLAKYIRDLLFRYECVIVPEFGGFLTKTISAKIDEETQTLHPPTKRLGFNSQLVDNDGLLANYITSVDQIPYEAALNFIDFEVIEWQKKLQNENVVLEGVGYFSLNEEQKLQFEPDTTINYLTDAFGLGTLMAPEITRLEPLHEDVVFDLITGDISDKEIYLNTDPRRKSFAPILKYAALIAVLFTVGYYLAQVIIKQNKDIDAVAKLKADYEATLNKRIQEATFEINKTLPAITLHMSTPKEANNEENENTISDRAETTSSDSEKEIAPETEVIESIAEIKETSPEKEATHVLNTVENTANSTNTVLKFHIIGGAFNQSENAIKKVNQLKDKGYNASIVGVNKWNLTQVAFGSFATREEAQVFLRQIKATEAKDAWMLVK